MGYFEKLAENSFRRGPDGELIFYANGVLGAGRVIPDAETEVRAYAMQMHSYKLALFVGMPYGLIAGWTFGISWVVLLPIFLVTGYLVVRQYRFLKPLQKHARKLSFREASRGGAKVLPNWYYWFLGCISVASLSLVMLLPLMVSKPVAAFLPLLLGLALIALMGLLLSIYLYRVKNDPENITPDPAPSFLGRQPAEDENDTDSLRRWPGLNPLPGNTRINQAINPWLAALILLLFIVPIGARFYLASRQADNLVGSFYLTDGADGSFYIQMNDKILKVDPDYLDVETLDVSAAGINPHTQLGFFGASDALVRKGEWEMSPQRYLAMADAEDPAQQQSVDAIVGNVSAFESEGAAGIFRCDLDILDCEPFHLPLLDYPHNYNVKIHRDGGVFITEGMAHKVSHYSSSGELLSSYDADLRFPKRVEFGEGAEIYIPNTNRHRIEIISTRTESLDGREYQTFGESLEPLKVGEDVTGDSGYTWPLLAKFFAGQWWVINMDDRMRHGRLFRFAQDGSFIDAWPLPEKADPRDLLMLDGQLLISDTRQGLIHRVDEQGQSLEPWRFEAVEAIVEPLNSARDRFEQLDILMNVLIGLVIAGLLVTLIRGKS